MPMHLAMDGYAQPLSTLRTEQETLKELVRISQSSSTLTKINLKACFWHEASGYNLRRLSAYFILFPLYASR